MIWGWTSSIQPLHLHNTLTEFWKHWATFSHRKGCVQTTDLFYRKRHITEIYIGMFWHCIFARLALLTIKWVIHRWMDWISVVLWQWSCGLDGYGDQITLLLRFRLLCYYSVVVMKFQITGHTRVRQHLKISITDVYSFITWGAVRAVCSGLCSWMKHGLAELAFLLRTCSAWLLSVNHMASSHEAQRLCLFFSGIILQLLFLK